MSERNRRLLAEADARLRDLLGLGPAAFSNVPDQAPVLTMDMLRNAVDAIGKASFPVPLKVVPARPTTVGELLAIEELDADLFAAAFEMSRDLTVEMARCSTTVGVFIVNTLLGLQYEQARRERDGERMLAQECRDGYDRAAGRWARVVRRWEAKRR